MAVDMRKTPSYLRGLAETRARAAGSLQRLKNLRSEVQRKLKVAKADVERYQKMEAELAPKLEEARTDLKSCDWLIRKFDSRLDPSEIEPIVAWKGRYGKRGALKETISRLLKDHAPMALSIPELSKVIILEFQLTYATDKALKAWAHNSLGGVLKTLLSDGLVERVDAPRTEWGGSDGRWRWKISAEAPLDELRSSAEGAGVEVTQAKRRGRPVKSTKTVDAEVMGCA
jgi:hypothetical protein